MVRVIGYVRSLLLGDDGSVPDARPFRLSPLIARTARLRYKEEVQRAASESAVLPIPLHPPILLPRQWAYVQEDHRFL